MNLSKIPKYCEDEPTIFSKYVVDKTVNIVNGVYDISDCDQCTVFARFKTFGNVNCLIYSQRCFLFNHMAISTIDMWLYRFFITVIEMRLNNGKLKKKQTLPLPWFSNQKITDVIIKLIVTVDSISTIDQLSCDKFLLLFRYFMRNDSLFKYHLTQYRYLIYMIFLSQLRSIYMLETELKNNSSAYNNFEVSHFMHFIQFLKDMRYYCNFKTFNDALNCKYFKPDNDIQTPRNDVEVGGDVARKISSIRTSMLELQQQQDHFMQQYKNPSCDRESIRRDVIEHHFANSVFIGSKQLTFDQFDAEFQTFLTKYFSFKTFLIIQECNVFKQHFFTVADSRIHNIRSKIVTRLEIVFGGGDQLSIVSSSKKQTGPLLGKALLSSSNLYILTTQHDHVVVFEVRFKNSHSFDLGLPRNIQLGCVDFLVDYFFTSMKKATTCGSGLKTVKHQELFTFIQDQTDWCAQDMFLILEICIISIHYLEYINKTSHDQTTIKVLRHDKNVSCFNNEADELQQRYKYSGSELQLFYTLWYMYIYPAGFIFNKSLQHSVLNKDIMSTYQHLVNIKSPEDIYNTLSTWKRRVFMFKNFSIQSHNYTGFGSFQNFTQSVRQKKKVSSVNKLQICLNVSKIDIPPEWASPSLEDTKFIFELGDFVLPIEESLDDWAMVVN